MFKVLVLTALSATLAFSQVSTTSPLDGTLTDPQGAVISGAEVQVANVENGQAFKTTTDERGHWVIPSMPAGSYRVTFTQKGFRTLTIDGVKLDAGVPATVNGKLEVGAVTETVDVTAGAEMVQSTSATLSSTLQARQVFELPFTSRNALELIVSQPGSQTTGTNRNSFINGLPFSGINITMDGINTQDNFYKSGDGFFTLIPARPDSLEEVTLTTSAAGAESLGQGAATVKFITKGGTNQFHGGAFWQHRNTSLNANYYFNNIDGLGRDRVILNQGGVHAGGPIKKNKLFFFTNYEIYRYPASTSATRTVLAPTALNGTYTYIDAAKTLHSVNVLDLAARNGYTSTQDPIMSKTLAQINSLTPNGTLRSLVPNNNDYNRNQLIFQPGGLTSSTYSTTRLDYNVTSKHQLSMIYTATKNNSTPDITNSVVSIFPGTGTVLGQNFVAGQRGNRYAGVVSLRSTLTPRLINEFRGGLNQAVTLFRDQVSSPDLFSQWRGYSPTLGFGLTGVASVSGSSRRKSPVKEIHDDLSWVKGSHLVAFGGSFTQVDFWQQTLNTNTIPTIAFGLATNDPVNTGTTSIFTAANFPGSSTTDLSNAGALYALLTGRVSSISRAVSLQGSNHQYATGPQIDLNRQDEYGIYVQDTWRVSPSLTVSLGLRYEKQGTFQNRDSTYSAVSLAGIYGISGVGNLYKPNNLTGVHPVFTPYKNDYTSPAFWSPSAGIAWQLPGVNGPLGWVLGRTKGKSVLRAGYSIATLREGTYTFWNIYGSNVGLRADDSVSPGTFPQYFGAPGSVLFRDGTLPTRPAPVSPVYPIVPATTDSLNAFDPKLRVGYVQSWNIGFQREISKDTVMEVRYTGNHGLKEWRQVNVNETNTFENGFQTEFANALNNLNIARKTNPASNNFANAGLPGQVNIPILTTALAGATNDTTIATQLTRNQVGSLASSISTNATRMGNLTKAGYPVNFFVANPDVVNGGAFLMTNLGSSFYDAFQVEVRRRLAHGLQFQGSYVWSHSIINGASSDLADNNQPSTFRNLRLDRANSGFDIRHAYKINSIYELPFGPGRPFLAGSNPVLRKFAEGWQVAGVSRMQSGAPFGLGGASTLTTGDTSAVLYNMTADQLQDMMQIRKTTGSDGKGLVYYLPQSFIDNTNAAWEVNGKTLANLDPTKPYIGRQLAPGQFGYRLAMRNPWQYHLDLSVLKHTRIREKADVEFRVQFLDALNITNFFLANAATSASFGQTRTAFRDFAGSADPGSRMIEFVLRVNF